MVAFPERNPRLMRAPLLLAAITALVVFGVPRAKAEDKAASTATPSRPPVSAAAVDASKDAKPAPSTTTDTKSATATKPVESKAVTATPSVSKETVSTKTDPKSETEGGMTLRAGQDRTDFRSMTIEGEDRVQVEVERPELALELDAEKVPGLESGGAADVMNRVAPDLTSAYLGISSRMPSPYVGRPWLRQFVSGPVARFQPNVKGVERWKLVVLDSKGEVVRTFSGTGDAPKEITWDGRSQNAALVTPGLTYSYYFEAFDKAGNKRNFVGEGFKVSAYRADSPAGAVLVFSGQSVIAAQKNGRAFGMGAASGSRAVPAVILEAVSWINQSSLSQPIQVTVSARSYEQANFLAKQVAVTMSELALGDPSRVRTSAEVAPDAADGGVVRVSLGTADPTTGVAPASSVVPAKDQPKSKDAKEAKKDKKDKKDKK